MNRFVFTKRKSDNVVVATGKKSEDVEPEESRSVSASQTEKSDCVEDQVRVCGGDARDDRAGPSSSSEIADFLFYFYLVAYLSSYHEKAINALYELA